MDEKLALYLKLNNLFVSNGYELYLVGGTVRDYLLGLPLDDMDAVTTATPEQMKTFLNDADFTFARFGSVKYKFDHVKFDITTLREEKTYSDNRHPNEVNFIKDLKIDVKRRDFTINGLYLNKNLEVVDYVNGQSDLKNHLIKMIGDPENRIKEDPLRIIRALRFALDFDFIIDEELAKAIRNNLGLLNNLTPAKISQDIKKIKTNDKEKIFKLFNKFNIAQLLDVVE